MRRSFFLVAVILVAVVGSARPLQAQSASVVYDAVIRAGACDTEGAVSATLNQLEGPATVEAGAESASPAATSYSVVGVALATLLESPYVIEVRSAGSGETLSCGEFGGAQDGNNALSFGLRPLNGSGLSGIAYLAPSGASQVGISVFVAETELLATLESAPLPDASPAPVAIDSDGDLPYATTARLYVTLLVGSLQRIDALFDVPQTESAWADRVYAELALWQLLNRAAQLLTPPESLEAFHDQLLVALALLDGAADDIFVALQEGDQELLDEAVAAIDEAIRTILALDESGGSSDES